jgi:hypothetical protein
MVTRKQAVANKLPLRERRPLASKYPLEQLKKAPASKNPPAKARPKVAAPVKGILKKPPPPSANFTELSPNLEETPMPSSPPVIVKSTPLPPPCVVLCSVEVTVDKEHLFAIAYTLDFGVVYVPRYTTILVNITKELDLKRYAKLVLIPTKWAYTYRA